MRRLRGRVITLGFLCAIATQLEAQSVDTTSLSGLDTVRFSPTLGVDLARSQRTVSGAVWRDLVVGGGADAYAGRLVSIRFALVRPDGVRIGSDSLSTFQFSLGDGIAMPGLDDAVRGMSVGGRRQMILPPQAQGDAGKEGIPGVPVGTSLVFTVELLRATDQ